MRKIKTSDITTGVGMPIKSGTLDQLQLAYQEALDALAKYNVGLSATDSTNFHVLYGCVNSGSGTSYVISAGAIYFNGEIYLTSAQSVTTTGSNVVVGTITTTYNTTNADPVTFTDASSKNVHEIRKIVWSNAASGSGNVNYSSIRFLTWQSRGNVGNTGFSIVSGTGTLTSTQVVDYKRLGDMVILSLYFNVTISTYSGGGYFEFKLPLPVNAYIPDAYNSYTVPLSYLVSGATTYKSCLGLIYIDNGQYLTVSIKDTATGSTAIYGQIMYKAQ